MELEKLAKLAQGQRFWTGGSRESGGTSPWSGMWHWTDNAPFAYTELSHGKSPSGAYNGKEELSIEVISNSINDRNGEDELPYICKWR